MELDNKTASIDYYTDDDEDTPLKLDSEEI
jgi:hypothetical protein